MDLRARDSLRPRLNDREWMVPRTKRKRNPAKYQETREIQLRKRVRNGHKLDAYCWICHQLGHEKACSLCPRVYHVACLKGCAHFENKVCPECLLPSVEGGRWSSGCGRLRELLMYAMDRVFSDKKNIMDMFFQWPFNVESKKLCQVMDAEILCEKLKTNAYERPVELYSDFKWIYHNCCIVYGDKSGITRSAEHLLKKLNDELCNLEACEDCYFYKNSNEVEEADYFCNACKEPHEIVWAKVKGYSYWPAKCLKVTSNGSARVAFFGTHETACVPANMWFSLKNAKTKVSSQQQQYCSAMKELLSYVNTENVYNIQAICNNTSETVEKSVKETQTCTSDFCDTIVVETSISRDPEILSVDSIHCLLADMDGSPESSVRESQPAIPTTIASPSISQSAAAVNSDTTSSDTVSVTMTFTADTAPSAKEADNCFSVLNLSPSTEGDLTHSPVECKPEPSTSAGRNVFQQPATTSSQIVDWNKLQSSIKQEVQLIDSMFDNHPYDDDVIIIDLPTTNLNGSKPWNVSSDNVNKLALNGVGQNAQFNKFFKENKSMLESLLVNLWSSLQNPSTTPPSAKEPEKELENQLMKTNVHLKSQQSQIEELTRENNKILLELKNELDNVKKQNDDLNKKYHNLENEKIGYLIGKEVQRQI